MVWKGFGDPGVQISLSISFTRASNPFSLFPGGVHTPTKGPPSYSISQGQVRLGVFKMSSHSKPREKWN